MELTGIITGSDKPDPMIHSYNCSRGRSDRSKGEISRQAIEVSLLDFMDQVPRIENRMVALNSLHSSDASSI
jgi:hypothetical protein